MLRLLWLIALVGCDSGLGPEGGGDGGGDADADADGDGDGDGDTDADGDADGDADVGPDFLAPFRAACPWMDAHEYARPSDAFFEPDVIQDLSLELDPADWEWLLQNPDLEEYRPGTLTWCGVRFDGVGLRFRRSSHPAADLPEGDPKNPMLIDLSEFADGQKLLGLRHVNLEYGDDLMLVAERMMWEVVAAHGATASRVSSARLVVNGELSGVFTNVERVDRSYARDRWNEDDGNLYKHQYCGTFDWLGPDPAPYLEDDRCYEKKTNEELADWSDIIHFMDVLNNTPDDQIETALPEVLEVDELITLVSALQALGYADTPNANANNFYTYHVDATGRFRVIPWDLDGGFPWDEASCEHPADTIGWDLFRISRCYDALPLFDRLVGQPAWRQRYLEQVRAFVDGPFAPEAYAARVQEIVDQLAPALAEDTHRRGDDAQWQESIATLLDRQSRRVDFVRGQLGDEGL